MKRIQRLNFLVVFTIFAGLAILLQLGYFFSSTSAHMIDSTAILRLGDPSLSHLGGVGASIDRHPAGINFYQKVFPRSSHGAAEFTHGAHSFRVDNVLSVMGTEDTAVSGGITDWSINFGPTDQQADTPETAKNRIMQFLSTLRAAGWKRYIDVDRPRLDGRQAWQYGTTGSAAGDYSLDSTYTPTIDEWETSASNFPEWIFYADGVYVEISLQESNMGGFVGKKTYLVSVDIKNEYAFYCVGFFGGHEDQMRDWKALLPAELKRYHAIRMKTEAELKTQGYSIDTTYQDPAIRALASSQSASGK
jgi:hypothetical protein